MAARKLIIQIPCYNEEKTLGLSLRELPRTVPGFDVVEWLVIDDGSRDNTVQVALENGVDHIVRVPTNRGLANGFRTGLRACVQLGADVIVNTDADNQYCAEDIPKLTQPVLDGVADMVVGARPIATTEHFTWRKKLLQFIGSFVVRMASSTPVADAPSGFRAISREAAKRLNVFSDYTYTLETIIQAGHQRLRVVSVPIRTNADLRPSKLLRSISSYVRYSAITIIRVFVAYKPFSFFGLPGLLSFLAGASIGVRFLWYWMNGSGGGHVQSLILASILLGAGTMLMLLALIADLVSVNRKLLEKVDARVADIEEHLGVSTLAEPKPAKVTLVSTTSASDEPVPVAKRG